MSTRTRHSLAAALVVLAAALLIAAFTLPFMHSRFEVTFPWWMPDAAQAWLREWMIEKGRIPVGEQYILEIVRKLFVQRELFVGTALLLFSVVFPIVKIVLAGWLVAGAGRPSLLSGRVVHHLERWGRWSMADIFVGAVIIVFIKAEGFHFQFSARAGIVAYGASAISAALALWLIERTHRARIQQCPYCERELAIAGGVALPEKRSR